MSNKLFFEVREIAIRENLTTEELVTLIVEMREQGFDYEGINPNNGHYSFIKFYNRKNK
jgi:hypothetical protein